MKQSRILTGYLFVIFSAVIFGLMPLMARHIYADGVDPLTLVLLRNAVSMPALLLLALLTGGTLRISLRTLPKIGFIAVMGCALTPLLLFSSYRYLPSGTATVFHFIYPAAVVIGELLILRRGLPAVRIVSVAMCIVGVALFCDPGGAFHLRGSLLALLSGVTYAVYILALSNFKEKGRSVFAFAFYVTVICTAVLLAVCLAGDLLALPRSAFGWGLSILFALSVNVGAVVLFQKGTFLIGGSRASILSALEPITGVLAGILFLHEPIGLPILLGTALVVGAGVLIALGDARKKK